MRSSPNDHILSILIKKLFASALLLMAIACFWKKKIEVVATAGEGTWWQSSAQKLPPLQEKQRYLTCDRNVARIRTYLLSEYT